MSEIAVQLAGSELWLLEQVQFCLQHELNASLQTSHYLAIIVAGGARRFVECEIPECITRHYRQASSFRHCSLSADDPLVGRALAGQPVSELLWRCAWQAWNGDVLPGGSFNRRGRLRALPAAHLLVEGLTAERELIQQLAKLLYQQALTSRQLADLSGAPDALAERFFATAECAGLLE
ncbi:hypothetical protein [Oceanobacter antarcticus]|jgi:hypothetical protein|uniref:Uncharacterized protein n=1 Tax=Oceanobacter antarcticus TaxID=3133425 RepID=A0ABW8NM26_9GAMM